MQKSADRLSKILENALLTGEVPYQANRRAMRAFDVRNDVDAGNAELDTVEDGIGEFIKDLRDAESYAREVAKNATTFL